MTIKQAKSVAKELGCSLTVVSYVGDCNKEYRVRQLGNKQDDGYFTQDLDDAIATARAMSGFDAVQKQYINAKVEREHDAFERYQAGHDLMDKE